ncbi:hypothetical protein B0H14DRAFT_3175740 [Mycena olivaceomarginata]|nr:hypothetical protein B0H14DRAFT_3175740 [Mycena olivaceomarginata]
MATQTNRTYSEFFSSGLRAISGGAYSRPSTGTSSPRISSPPVNALKSSGRYNVLRGISRRARTSSSPTSPMTPPIDTTTTSTRKQRRTSIVDLPSRLLGRMINSDRLPGPCLTRPTGYEKIRPITDPFDASPYTGSFFIDYVETPVSIPTPPRSRSRSQTQRPQSFLLLGEPTQTKTPYLGFSLRRPRPTSIQSMPLPLSQSRRSSFQYHPMSRDKYDDRSWALEEEETPSLVWSEDAEAPHDPAASIDWHQFHNDLLHEDA